MSAIKDTAVANQPAASGDGSDQAFDYENFMRKCPVYHDVNKELIEFASVPGKRRIIDLGCGTGNITRNIIERLDSFKDVIIYAVDTSQSMLREAARRLRQYRDLLDIRFVHGDVLEAPDKVDAQVDAIIYCNSIHYVSEKARLFDNVKNLLVPGGVFAANSSFIRESHEKEHVGDDYKFYLDLMIRAVRKLKQAHHLKPLKYVAESRKRLSIPDYAKLVDGSGMRLLRSDMSVRPINFDCWYSFLNFKDFVEGALPGVPVPIGRVVLREAARNLMVETRKYTQFNRAWLQLVAQKV